MATQMLARCSMTNREVIAELSSAVIDDEAMTYRWTCADCAGQTDERPLTGPIREVLRAAGVPTLDELVLAGAALLEDDSNIWRGLLST